MKPGLKIRQEPVDEDLLLLRIDICDGSSSFRNTVYVSQQQLGKAVEELHAFKEQIHGGTFNLRFGVFGEKHGPGALDARLEFRKRGKILVQVAA